MNVARILNGIVINIEVADQEWFEANSVGSDGSILIPYTNEQPAYIGLSWSKENGFEQPSEESEELNAMLSEVEDAAQ